MQGQSTGPSRMITVGACPGAGAGEPAASADRPRL